jgi:putative CocE/NonD family hydrolase
MISDPENPVVVISNLMEGAGDFQESQKDPNMLVYTSPLLESDLTIIGESKAVIYVSCTTPDADLIVGVTEVFPDGRAINLGSGGALRLRYRKGFDTEHMLKKNEVYRVEIPIAYIGHSLAAGNRLRLTISGTAYPLMDPNPNTGEDIASAVRLQKSEISIHHDAKRPSHIELPVVDL